MAAGILVREDVRVGEAGQMNAEAESWGLKLSDVGKICWSYAICRADERPDVDDDYAVEDNEEEEPRLVALELTEYKFKTELPPQ